jgi:hypothetical protein
MSLLSYSARLMEHQSPLQTNAVIGPRHYHSVNAKAMASAAGTMD